MVKTQKPDASSSSKQTTRKRHRSKNRRSDLTRIAYGLIAENGLEGFRTRQVAEAAGIDTGTLHYHYPSKEALIEAVVDYMVADFQINRAATRSKSASVLDELCDEIYDVALRVRQSPEQFRVLIDLRVHAARNRGIANVLAKQDRNFEATLVSLVSRGIERGEFRQDADCDLAARVLRTQLVGLSFMALLAPKRINDVAEALYEQMKAWLATKPKAE